MTAPGRLVVATPWYPTPDKPYGGSFVRQWVRALAWPRQATTVIHLEMVEPGDPRQPVRQDTPEGDLIWIPVKVGHRLPRAAAARAQGAALAAEPLAAAALESAEVVFAHVVMPTGAAVRPRPGQRLVLVEHASYVPQLLRHPEARSAYGQAVAMSDAVLTAGEETARLLRVAFPASRSRIWAVGNPIDSADFPFVERPAEAPLERWLYVGNLDASKGVFAVLKGFAAFAAARPGPDPQPPERPGGPDPRLEMAGQGPALEGLKELARRLGLADRVVFLGGLDRAGVAAAMARADLQIHLSPAETFGIAPLEGLLSGLPVLAVRNCGTAQTMPPAVAAGRAVLIDPPFGRRVGPRVAQAVARLEAAVRQAAPGAAQAVRDALERRYGTTHFGAIERRVAVGLPPFEPVPAPIPPGPARPAEPEVAQPPTASALAAGAAVPGPAGPGAAAEVAPSASEPLSSASALVAVALTDHGWGELAGRVGEALLAGRPVTVLTVDGGLAAGLDPRIESRLVADPAPWARPLAKLIGRLAAAPLKAAVAVERRAGRLRRRRKADGPPRMAERQLRLSAWRRRLEPTLRRAATSRRQIARLAAAAAAAAPTAEVITAPRELPEPGDGPFVSNSGTHLSP